MIDIKDDTNNTLSSSAIETLAYCQFYKQEVEMEIIRWCIFHRFPAEYFSLRRILWN